MSDSIGDEVKFYDLPLVDTPPIYELFAHAVVSGFPLIIVLLSFVFFYSSAGLYTWIKNKRKSN